MKKFLCLDTNIFEHFPAIEQIDWLTISSCNEATLVIPLTNPELNRHKDTSPKGRLKRRAAAALSQLTRLSRLPRPIEVRKHVDIVFLKSEPLLDFEKYHLTRDIADDYLIASAIEFAQERALAPEQALVVTADLGLELKVSGQSQVVACPMPDSWRLPDELDAEERQISALQDQVKNLSSQFPDLKLDLLERFPGRQNDMATVHWRNVSLTENELAAQLEEERKDHPYLCARPAPPPGYQFRRADPRVLQQYNDYLNGYFRLYLKYLKDCEEVQTWRSRTRALVLVLSNDGGISATDIQITLKFPKGISILSDDDYKKEPRLPLPPSFDGRKTSQMEKVEDYIGLSEPQAITVAAIRNFPGGSEVILTAKYLKHTCKDSRALNVHFQEEADVHPFQFDYEIWMSNFPRLIKGGLTVAVKLEKTAVPEDGSI